MGAALEAKARVRSEALLAQHLAAQSGSSAVERLRKEAARRAAVLADWEVEPLPGASGGGGGRKKKGGKKNKKNKKKKSKSKSKPSTTQPRPATALAAAGGGGVASAAAPAPTATAAESEELEEQDEEVKQPEKEEPVDRMDQHDDDCAMRLVSMEHSRAKTPTTALRCGHEFHAHCLKDWMGECTAKRYVFRCPLCNDESSKDMRF